MHGSYFETGHSVEDLIFKGLTISSVGGFIGLCICIFILTFLHEALRVFRQGVGSAVLGVPVNPRISSASSPTHEGSPNSESPARSERTFLVHVGKLQPRHLSRTKFHILQSFLYVLQLFIAYLLMLVVMSYNAWLFLCVLLGAGIAHLTLGVTSLSSSTMIATPDSSHCDNGH